MAKWFELDEKVHLNASDLIQDLNIKRYDVLNRKLVEKSMTVLQNTDDLLPLKRLDTLNIALVSIGEQSNQFQQTLSNYASIKMFHLSEQHSDKKEKRCWIHWLNTI